MKKCLALLMTTTMLFGLTACGMQKENVKNSQATQAEAKKSNEAEKTTSKVEQTVVFWHSLGGALGDELNAIVKEYNEGQGKDKGIKVDAVFQGYKGTDKVILAYQTKDTSNACDINVGLVSTIPSMLSLDWTKPVEELLIDKSTTVKKDDFYPGLLRSVTYENKMIAVPFLNSTLQMYCNLDALKEAGIDAAPKTVDELLPMLPKLLKKDDKGVSQYGLECQVKRYQLVNFIVSQKADAFFGDKEGGRAGAMTKLVCDEDGTLDKFLEQWEKVIKTGAYQPVENKLTEEFAAGKTALAIMSSSKVGSVTGLVKDKFKWVTVPFPKINADDTSGAAVGGSCLVLFNRGDEKRMLAAWDFMQYLSTPKVQTRIVMKSGYLPTTVATEKEADLQKFYTDKPNFKTALEIMKSSSPMTQEPMDLTYNEINKVITNAMEKFCSGKISKDDAKKQIIEESNKLLKDWHEANG